MQEGTTGINQRIKVISLIFCALTLVFGCKKDKISIRLQEISSPVSERIEKTFWKSPTEGFLCGGTLHQSGFVYKTTNSGQSWTKVFATGVALFDVYFINDSVGYVCGEDLLLYKTINAGQTWQEYVYPVAAPYYDVIDLRCIFGNQNFMMVLGGENFNKGVGLVFEADVFTGYFYHFDHEFRSGIAYSAQNYELFGYGASYKTRDTGLTYSPTTLSDDFFTGAVFVNGKSFACGYNGGIYSSSDFGSTWNKNQHHNSVFKERIHLNGISMLNENSGYCVGNEGVILKTTDGLNWKFCETNINDHFTSITHTGNLFIVSTNTGKIFSFPF